MKFGSVDNVEGLDLSLPKDHPDTKNALGGKEAKSFHVSVGCAKWNKSDLKNFYPKGTKDELAYYSTQFNSIELNATFYQPYGREQFIKWREKTPDNFKFFPKIPQTISHLKRLNDVRTQTEDFCHSVSALEEKLGMVFLQMHDNFKPKDFERLEKFVQEFPKATPLAIELRNSEWFQSQEIFDQVSELFKQYNITNVLVDTAGRRDIMHMRMTTKTAFIRYVGANHPSDYDRLDPWIDRIAKWKKNGLENLYFFVHQNHELESPLLSAYLIERLNDKFDLKLHVPQKPEAPTSKAKKKDEGQGSLF
ncbi:MAG: hypothetical protein K0R65_718 [Crocinitomicaceae bacterium]|jgi:uncharacterized protein YecE (DUF72 family)|nr:hypothetical protein [Crocinitomicaceae bacterium]